MGRRIITGVMLEVAARDMSRQPHALPSESPSLGQDALALQFGQAGFDQFHEEFSDGLSLGERGHPGTDHQARGDLANNPGARLL